MILYIDNALSREEMKQAETHLSRCPRCRTRLNELENNLQTVMRKMDLLEPPEVPEAVFKPPAKVKKTTRFPKPFKYQGLDRLFKPAYVTAAISIICTGLLLVLFYLPGTGPKPRPNASAKKDTGTAETFAIRSITMEKQPAQTFIIKEKETKTTIIWVEKKM
jgi:hypothetical protein